MKTIGICAPSNWVDPERFEQGINVLKELGAQVKIHPQVEERHFQCAGTHAQRAQALMDLYIDPEVDIIMAAAGGHRALHLMDKLDYEVIKNNPKTLIGFSDTTAILNSTFSQSDMCNIYGPSLSSFADGLDEKDLHTFAAFLKEGTLTGELPIEYFAGQTGTKTSHIIGGNLCLFSNIMHTKYQPKLKGAVLILEDDGEELRNVDRMLLHLKNQGVFNKVSAVILGEFTNIKDTEHKGRPFAKDLKSILEEHMQDVPCAVYINAPFGHGSRLFPLPIGRADIVLQKNKLSFKML
ncbi:MAG: LD-carboxypeptidase [Alphaproteobacteria bacterium]|nr:LD-carboxypeptidase [Alphaproteobacteria bacterium]